MAIVGTLTKWAEALPMQDEIAETVAKIFVGKIVCRFGFPAQIHSDQLRRFEAIIFKEMCQLMGINKL